MDEEENLSDLFEINGKHVLEYLSLLKLGKKPLQFNVQKNGTRYENDKHQFTGHTTKNGNQNVKILNGLQSHQAKHSIHQRYNSHSIKQSISLENEMKNKQIEMAKMKRKEQYELEKSQ